MRKTKCYSYPMKLLLSLLISSILMFAFVQIQTFASVSLSVKAAVIAPTLPKIISINLPNLTLQHHEKYKLPQKVSVQLSNNTKKLMPITWSGKAVYANTSKTGTITQYGVLAAAGYSRQIKLIFTVIPYLVSVPELSFQALQFSEYKLPQTIALSYSDGVSRQSSVNWQESTVSTTQDGIQLYHGTVDGWNKTVLLTLEVLPMKIISATAENGSLLVQLSNPPGVLPSASSFAITGTKLSPASASSALSVSPVSVEPSDSSGTKFKLSFPSIKQGFDNITYQLRVSFNGGTSFQTNTIEIPALTVASDSFDPTILNSQQFYKAVKYALGNYLETIEFQIKNYSDKEYNLDMIEKVIYEHPEIDYSYYYSSSSIGKPNIDGYTSYHLKLKYKLTKERMHEEKQASEQKAKGVVAQLIKPEMTDYQKELALHDYLVSTTDYDSRASTNLEPIESHNSYGALILGIGVCESYAKALSLLFETAGLTQRYVIGDAIDDGAKVGHAWNMVQLDGEWYQVDATWDDPSSSTGTTRVRHDYFNLTDSMISKDHIKDESTITFPSATGTKYYYYNLRGTEQDRTNTPMQYVSTLDEYKTELSKALAARKPYISFILLNCSNVSYNTESALDAVHTGSFGFGVKMWNSKHPTDPNIAFEEIQFTYQ